MAIEDSAALGILFSKPYFGGDVSETLEVYQKIRLPRATKVQASAAKAAININERIGMPELYQSWRLLIFQTDNRFQVSPVIPTSRDTKLRMRSKS